MRKMAKATIIPSTFQPEKGCDMWHSLEVYAFLMACKIPLEITISSLANSII